MARLSEDDWKIIRDFQSHLRDTGNFEFQKYSLQDLKHLDQRLGILDQHADYRLAIKNRIESLEKEEIFKKDQVIHRGNIKYNRIAIFVAIAAIIVSTVLSVLFWYLR